MWVHFTSRFRWRPKPGVSIRYDAGMRLRVTRACAAAALAACAAEKIVNLKTEKRHGARSDD